MTDYTAHEIHRLDRAYPDAVNTIDDLTGDPARKARLAEVGPQVFAAELTRDLANSAANPMSLAAWAAVATVRLMVAGRSWEDDTDAAWAKVDQLTAERDEAQATAAVRQGQLAKSREQVTTLANEVGRLVAENARVRQQRDEALAEPRQSNELVAYANENEQYLIWSQHHQSWWGPSRSGYRRNPDDAGRYTLAAAQAEMARGCYCCRVPEVPVAATKAIGRGDRAIQAAITEATELAIAAGQENKAYDVAEAIR